MDSSALSGGMPVKAVIGTLFPNEGRLVWWRILYMSLHAAGHSFPFMRNSDSSARPALSTSMQTVSTFPLS